MVWCSYCGKDQVTERDDINGFICCTGCGRVLDDNIYSSDPTFTKGAGGQSQVVGNFVRDGSFSSFGRIGIGSGHLLGYQSDSHERTLNKGRDEIRDVAEWLSVSGREDAVNAAHRLYVIAVERNFTRGRRTQQVAAACLYIVCRQESKPYMLIDFSDCLQTNVYVLGAVFLQLCRLLRLEQHPMMQKPVDPSLFIHRFTDRLLRRKSEAFEKKHHAVANTALRLVASMKRDWMQTGRRPSGICGAALFISAHIHGFECTKNDVVSVVHICEGTLKKRLDEFGSTESGRLTPEEFETKAKELELQMQTLVFPSTNNGVKGITEILCEHKDIGASHFAHGLCRVCYDDFIKVSGGIEGGSAPPAFQRAEKKRLIAIGQPIKNQELLLDEDLEEELQLQKIGDDGKEVKPKPVKGKRSHRGRGVKLKGHDPTSGAATGTPVSGEPFPHSMNMGGKEHEQHHVPGDDDVLELYATAKDHKPPFTRSKIDSQDDGGLSAAHPSEVETVWQHPEEDRQEDEEFTEADSKDERLSDIDDDEMTGYLNNEEEIRLKTIIWTEMNKEYIQEQEAKEAANLAAQEASLAAVTSNLSSTSEIAAAAAALVLKKMHKRKRGHEGSKKEPAESAAEATRQMLESKKLSSKVNYSVLAKLFDGTEKTVKTDLDESKEVQKDDEKSERHVQWKDLKSTTFDHANMRKNIIESKHKVDSTEEEDKADIDTDVEVDELMDIDNDGFDGETEHFNSFQNPYDQDDEYEEY
ncbi:hypothetical protein O6H91_18G063700 [Diphasiastrum complanatum]|uniref:Uncharacterized protein n=4 Tax=Diphasiastrum complanatum TaxID=34168 RepID=A0ACC2B227_DIPCM|nr:hypothetical protein O6H91_18G063700 [Diphasiastrum complanatum]KAJ7523819.1 hypothetical protein O6H91_18G063700 [Diphasiastrum complanatum]KAJ7523820.1 hypothetical protein O6H91_18G063700 [Diphasiastrum complanatum]KAJ7523823.1 hypothetical protein O6H91_18G063700 [Diphasiastrum complanatum]